MLAVLTGADLLADGLKPIPHRPVLRGAPDITLRNRDGSDAATTPHYPLPADKVRFVGEAVAMVVADLDRGRQDRRRTVAVDYEPLAAVTHAMASAAGRRAARVQGRHANVCVDAEVGDAAATEAAFARAAHVVSLDTWVQRVTGVPMEPRAAVGAYDARDRPLHAHAGSGNVVRQKSELAGILGVGRERGARDRARRRRQFRHPQRVLSGVRAGVLGGAPARAAGEMDLRAQRSPS